jgi:hypothetical protein
MSAGFWADLIALSASHFKLIDFHAVSAPLFIPAVDFLPFF